MTGRPRQAEASRSRRRLCLGTSSGTATRDPEPERLRTMQLACRGRRTGDVRSRLPAQRFDRSWQLHSGSRCRCPLLLPPRNGQRTKSSMPTAHPRSRRQSDTRLNPWSRAHHQSKYHPRRTERTRARLWNPAAPGRVPRYRRTQTFRCVRSRRRRRSVIRASDRPNRHEPVRAIRTPHHAARARLRHLPKARRRPALLLSARQRRLIPTD